MYNAEEDYSTKKIAWFHRVTCIFCTKLRNHTLINHEVNGYARAPE